MICIICKNESATKVSGTAAILIAEIAEDLRKFVHKDEDACHYAARMLIQQVAWRKDKEASDAAYEENRRSENAAL